MLYVNGCTHRRFATSMLQKVQKIQNKSLEWTTTHLTTSKNIKPLNLIASGLKVIDNLTDAIVGKKKENTATTMTFDSSLDIKKLSSQIERQKRYKLITKEERDLFKLSLRELLKENGCWTFEKFKNYSENMYHLSGGNSITAKIYSKLQTIPGQEQMKKKLTIFDSMTPSELHYKSANQFDFKTRLLLAEASNVTPEDVAQLFIEFDILKTDRTWYYRRIALGRPLPDSLRERQWLAEWDRPRFSSIVRKSMTLENYIIEKHREKEMKYSPNINKNNTSSLDWKWKRHPTCRMDRWQHSPSLKQPLLYRLKIKNSFIKGLRPEFFAHHNPPNIKHSIPV